jgi:hypothetical protein
MVDQGFRDGLERVREALSWVVADALTRSDLERAREEVHRLIEAAAQPAAGVSQYHGIVPRASSSSGARDSGERME